MLLTDKDRGDHVPQAVLALVVHELAFAQVAGQEQIALGAVGAGTGHGPVESGAGLLPAGGLQDVAIQVEQRSGHADQLGQVVQQGT